MRRREYVTLFGDRHSRRDIAGRPRPTRRWPLVLGIALAGVSAWYLLAFQGDPLDVDLEGTAVPPSILRPVETTTTLAGNVAAEDVTCPDPGAPWTTFQASPARTGCIDAPTISEPVVLWSAATGVQGWLNNPVIRGSTVYVGSAGATQFESDGDDGIYALDLLTGEQRWFFPATLDTNGVAVSEGVVVATGDEGLVWGIDAATGRQIWVDDLGSAVFGNPLIVEGTVVVGDGRGEIVALDVATGQRRWIQQISGAVRGGASSDGTIIVAAGETGEVLAADLNGTELWRRTVTSSSAAAGATQVFAAPTIVDRHVVVSLVRADVDPEPAFVSLDPASGTVQWRATDAAGIKAEWGNVRSSPAVVGDLLVYGEPYSSSLVAIERDTGATAWAVEVGPLCYPHWPSVAVVSGQAILARHDGGLYGIDLNTGTVAWSIYLGSVDASGEFPESYEQETFCDWQPAAGFSILASPAVSESGIVVVGTLEGHLIAVADESW
jgi:outer membrane protein assembly factor BamB